MLNAETKRRIDAARDVLVGVAPNPMTQIDQITYALIFKFMDDMDQQSVSLGGRATFFTGDLEPYAWHKLMDTRLGSQQKMDLYSEALTKFAQAQQLPELFRSIFAAAFLPYRQPDTLGLFLKEINGFDYSHPEELGNAYEYLLSIMSAQGGAGQFRTPRHIIDFMVDVINPTKDDLILDPACGTAGFLVSAYNHIIEQHDGKGEGGASEKPLTPAQKQKLMDNLVGYDIDPTMVRIAQVNMFLHQFKQPKIHQYDSLTSEERWNEKFDGILANPPFMSPKGGIKPHNRFGIKSNRSEVLFVDYIASHLKPNGRAAIIVPEGIVFQTGTAYKQLRKRLVESGLHAVVSLPAGVFNPYSAVKTSILLLDAHVANLHGAVAFFQVNADGFDLGATRRPTGADDLPQALESIAIWQAGGTPESRSFAVVSRADLLASVDCSLAAATYTRKFNPANSSWPMVPLLEVARLVGGGTPSRGEPDFWGGDIPWLTASHIGADGQIEGFEAITRAGLDSSSATLIPPESTVLVTRVSVGKRAYLRERSYALNQDLTALIPKDARILPRFLYYVANRIASDIQRDAIGVGVRGVSRKYFDEIKIPLPPLEQQVEIVAELDGYESIAGTARTLIRHWRPPFTADASWPRRKLLELASFKYGLGASGVEKGSHRLVRITDIDELGLLKPDGAKYVSPEVGDEEYTLLKGDIVVARTGATFGKCLYFDSEEPSVFAGYLIRLQFGPELLPRFFWAFSQSRDFAEQKQRFVTGGGQPQFNVNALGKIEVPTPPPDIQNAMVEQVSDELETLAGLRLLEASRAALLNDCLQRVWGSI